MSKLKVKDNPDLVRDAFSKAILNTNKQALFDHRRKRAAMKELYQSKDKVAELQAEMTDMKAELADIKAMLQELLAKKGK